MPRIAIVGAGSRVFAETLIGDVLSFPELSDSEFALMDVDEHRLSLTEAAAESMIASEGLDATVEATTDRREALRGADYVVNLINVGGLAPMEAEIEIPREYGVGQAIGDTLGPGGIFRGLRTVPTLLDIAADMRELCPDAVLLNYSNPMAICCWAVNEYTDVECYGLCHSVQSTASALADYVGVPADELDHWVAGINHMAWFLELEHDGRDLYPDLREAMADPEVYEQDTVRFELLRHFGAFVTESSHHASEYLPYFRGDEEQVSDLAGTRFAGRMPTGYYLDQFREWAEERDALDAEYDPESAEVERSQEYASRVVHGIESGTRYRLNLNVSNRDGLIANLPDAACVEVPCVVDGSGVHPCAVGDLPPQLAALVRTNVNAQERAVTAAAEADREAAFHAVKLDPLTAANCTLDEAHAMTEDLLAANAEWLPFAE